MWFSLIKSGDPFLYFPKNTKAVVPKVSQIKMIILRNVILEEPIMLSHNFLQPFDLRDNAYRKDILPKKLVVWWESKYMKTFCTFW